MLYVSLGAWCQVAQQLKNHVQDQLVPSAFDWIVGPLSSVSHILDTDGDNFCENLSLSKPSNSIICETYGILYHHEFERDENNEALLTEESQAIAKSKLTHKHKSMSARLRATEESVTFVRFGGHAQPLAAWPYSKDSAPVSPSEINKMTDAIERAFPDLTFRLLFITCPTSHTFNVDQSKLDPRVWTVEMPRREGCNWSGSNDDWEALISKVPDSYSKLTKDSPRQESPFANVHEHFKILSIFSKEQISAIRKLIMIELQMSGNSN